MKRWSAVLAMALTAAVPLTAQQQETPPRQTTTTRGDENTSIRATATAQEQQPATGEIRRPRQPGTQVTPRTTTAATRQTRTPVGPSARDRAAAAGNPDVLLEVPNLSVEQILLEVDNLRVHLNLDAQVANLVSLRAGVDATIGRVKLDIRGVQAEAYLTVRLDNVARILDRTLTTIDRNPQILERLLTTVDRTVGTVGGVADTALQPGGVVSQTVGTVGRTLENVTAPGGVLSQTVNTLGQTVQRTLDTTGNIVERTLDTTGRLVNERNVGRLLDMNVINQTTNAAGQIVRQVRDTTGAVIEYTLDNAGRVTGSRIVSGGNRRE